MVGTGFRIGFSGDYFAGSNPGDATHILDSNFHTFAGIEITAMFDAPPRFPNFVNWFDWNRGGLYRVPVLGPSIEYFRDPGSRPSLGQMLGFFNPRNYSMVEATFGIVGEGVAGFPSVDQGSNGILLPNRGLGNVQTRWTWRRPEGGWGIERGWWQLASNLFRWPDVRNIAGVVGYIPFTYANGGRSGANSVAGVPVPFVIIPNATIWNSEQALRALADEEQAGGIQLAHGGQNG